MRLSAFSFALAAGILWGSAIFLIGLVALGVPGYGDTVLSIAASIYPGFNNTGTLADLGIGVVYALFDGLVGGYIFARLYNFLIGLGVTATVGSADATAASEAAGT
ncbi:MAG: hypothetical protein ACE5HV_12680 [Acidobacteriota bacterium]